MVVYAAKAIYIYWPHHLQSLTSSEEIQSSTSIARTLLQPHYNISGKSRCLPTKAVQTCEMFSKLWRNFSNKNSSDGKFGQLLKY